MDNNVIALEKILGSLRQVSFYKNSHKCSDFIDTSRFSATKYILSCWSHYGQYNENRLVLMHEGNTDDIELNGYTISSTVKDIHFFLTSRDVNEHDFTFSIQASDGEVYEQTFHIENNELLEQYNLQVFTFFVIEDIVDRPHAIIISYVKLIRLQFDQSVNERHQFIYLPVIKGCKNLCNIIVAGNCIPSVLQSQPDKAFLSAVRLYDMGGNKTAAKT